MKTIFQKFFPGTGLIITIATIFILLEGLSFAYIRQHSSNAGFNHHSQVHMMYYYNHAFGDTDVINTTLMYIHWPLLKIEGLLTNRNISMLYRYKYIEVHRILNKPKKYLYSSSNTYKNITAAPFTGTQSSWRAVK